MHHVMHSNIIILDFRADLHSITALTAFLVLIKRLIELSYVAASHDIITVTAADDFPLSCDLKYSYAGAFNHSHVPNTQAAHWHLYRVFSQFQTWIYCYCIFL